MEVIRSATCSASRSLPTRKDLYWWICPPPLSPPPPPSLCTEIHLPGWRSGLHAAQTAEETLIIESLCTQQALESILKSTFETLIQTHPPTYPAVLNLLLHTFRTTTNCLWWQSSMTWLMSFHFFSTPKWQHKVLLAMFSFNDLYFCVCAIECCSHAHTRI